jgi:hypothetical protein
MERVNVFAKQEHCIEGMEAVETSNIGPGLRANVS